MGLKVATKAQLARVPMSYPPFSTTTAKTAVDLSGSLPPVGNQGNQSSCTAWASAYALKTYHERVERGWPVSDSSGQPVGKHVFSPAYIYNQANGGKDGGIYFTEALDLLIAQGVASLHSAPYVETDYKSQPSATARAEAVDFKIHDYLQADYTDVGGLKQYLGAGFPVLVGVNTDKGFHDAEGEGWTWERTDGPNYGPHALLIVGYDDARGAFRMVNSWGTAWGDKGYCWVAYRLLPKVATEAWVTRDVRNSGGVGAPTTQLPGLDEVSIVGVKPGVIDSDTKEKGVEILGKLRLQQGLGTTCRVVVYFSMVSGNSDTQDPMRGIEPAFKDGQGRLAAYLPETAVEPQTDSPTTEWRLFIPERAIAGPSTKGEDPLGSARITIVPVVYVDQLGVAKGRPVEVVGIPSKSK